MLDVKIPEKCGQCPCFHAENPMYCQAVKADRNKRIVAPYRDPRPEWCPISIQKPPLGLKPRRIHDLERMIEIIEAVERYSQARMIIPKDWFSELKDLLLEAEDDHKEKETLG